MNCFLQRITRKKLVLNNKHNIIYYTPAIGWGILILYFSLLPREEVPQVMIIIEDFLIHFGIYFLLALLISLGSIRFKLIRPATKTLIWAFVISSVLGGFLELAQEFLVVNRTGTLDDFLANNLGALAATLTFRLAKR